MGLFLDELIFPIPLLVLGELIVDIVSCYSYEELFFYYSCIL